jgi:hypothetical protein
LGAFELRSVGVARLSLTISTVSTGKVPEVDLA